MPKTAARAPITLGGDASARRGRGLDPHTSEGARFGEGSSARGLDHSPRLKEGAWPVPQRWGKQGVAFPYAGGRGVARLGVPLLWACARRSQGSRRRGLWRETPFEAGELREKGNCRKFGLAGKGA